MEALNLVKMSKSDIKKLSLVKNGDMGTTSKVYRLNDSECLKYFNYSMDEYDMYRLNKFTNLRFEGANLPNKLVIVNNKFRGYITDFINGESLETFNGLDYSEFVRSASTLLDNVHGISMERIRILDSHEGNGISKSVHDACDFIAKIPMYGKINSLNASVAAGIMIYEVIRSKK